MAITQKAFTTQTITTNEELKTPPTSKNSGIIVFNLGYLSPTLPDPG